MPTAPNTAAASGFAAQAARLVEAARANERAVRDLEEATQILAAGIDDIVEYADLADAVEGLSGQVALVRAAADEVRAVVDAAGQFAQVKEAAEEATQHVGSIAERLASVAGRAEAIDGRLSGLDRILEEALGHVERFDLEATTARIDALERKVDRVLELLERQGDAYAQRVEPQLARLEAVAERMDTAALADELADVLASNYLLVQALDTMRERNVEASEWFDGQLEGWRERHGTE